MFLELSQVKDILFSWACGVCVAALEGLKLTLNLEVCLRTQYGVYSVPATENIGVR
jgi:hypothetical protein